MCVNVRWRISGRARVWNGESTTLACSAALKGFSGRVIVLIYCPSWIPALDGIEGKLGKGGKVADVGCGHGASTILLAKAFPKSQFVGIDYHAPSIETATQRAKEAGVANVRFQVANATDYREKDFDLIAFFDCLHDMADPAGAARHARGALKFDGSCMLVEPFAADDVADNFNPVGKTLITALLPSCAYRFHWPGMVLHSAPKRASGGCARSWSIRVVSQPCAAPLKRHST